MASCGRRLTVNCPLSAASLRSCVRARQARPKSDRRESQREVKRKGTTRLEACGDLCIDGQLHYLRLWFVGQSFPKMGGVLDISNRGRSEHTVSLVSLACAPWFHWRLHHGFTGVCTMVSLASAPCLPARYFDRLDCRTSRAIQRRASVEEYPLNRLHLGQQGVQHASPLPYFSAPNGPIDISHALLSFRRVSDSCSL